MRPEQLQQRFIPATQRGELGWCQLFSEPGAGSDLASLTTRATKVDGGWRINGHKIWTTSAHFARQGRRRSGSGTRVVYATPLAYTQRRPLP